MLRYIDGHIVALRRARNCFIATLAFLACSASSSRPTTESAPRLSAARRDDPTGLRDQEASDVRRRTSPGSVAGLARACTMDRASCPMVRRRRRDGTNDGRSSREATKHASYTCRGPRLGSASTPKLSVLCQIKGLGQNSKSGASFANICLVSYMMSRSALSQNIRCPEWAIRRSKFAQRHSINVRYVLSSSLYVPQVATLRSPCQLRHDACSGR